MKSKAQKRQEAVERARSYKYEDSRAKKRGISEETWNAAREKHIEAWVNRA